MSAAGALKAARDAGVRVSIDGADLLLEAAAEPPRALLKMLSRHKQGLLALLRPGTDGWSGADWLALYNEDASIAKRDFGLSTTDAEAVAFERCLVEWLKRNPAPPTPGRCSWCRKEDAAGAALLPFGVGNRHSWLHRRCWPAWFSGRRTTASMALQAAGIKSPIREPEKGS
jgi:hypothetical protein